VTGPFHSSAHARGPTRWIRSFSTYQLIYLAMLAIVVPLVIVLAYALYEMSSLGATSRGDVIAAQQATDKVRGLADQLAEMERSALEYSSTRQPSAFAEYERMRSAFLESLDDVNGDNPRIHADLASLHAKESELYRRLSTDEEVGSALPLFADLYRGVEKLLEGNRQLVSSYAEQPLAEAGRIRTGLLWSVAVVLPLALFFGVRLLGTIVKSLTKLEDAIEDLGAGAFDAPVAIEGPADMIEVGRRLDWMRERLAALEAQKESFLREISHELKTPLTSIREGADLLREENGTADAGDRVRIARILYDNTLRLHSLIEKLLQVSRATSRIGDDRRTSVALDDVVRSVVRDHHLTARSRDVDVELDLPRTLVHGNERQLSIVVDNLFSNALKFCDAGGCVRVALSARNGCALLDVEDTGPGIAGDEAERVFDLFYRGSAMPSSPVQGTGLGLSIAREYANAHGGDVQVVPSTTGAHLRFSLPIDRAGTNAEARAAEINVGGT